MDDGDRAKRLAELKKQRDELDKIISELSAPLDIINTNIPYTPKFTSCYSATPEKFDLSNYAAQDLLQMKLFVNKKCNQVSTDYNHTILLINEMVQYKENALFKQIFTHKLIDQGRVQVSSHFESFKPLSYILFKLGAEDIVRMYVRLMISKDGNEVELRGIYAIYFGYINLKEDIENAWLWIASILNCQPSNKTGYVLETFLAICGDLLLEKCGSKFRKLVKYIKTHFLKELMNQAVETRIETILEKYVAK